jgi:hypothetical protein
LKSLKDPIQLKEAAANRHTINGSPMTLDIQPSTALARRYQVDARVAELESIQGNVRRCTSQAPDHPTGPPPLPPAREPTLFDKHRGRQLRRSLFELDAPDFEGPAFQAFESIKFARRAFGLNTEQAHFQLAFWTGQERFHRLNGLACHLLLSVIDRDRAPYRVG